MPVKGCYTYQTCTCDNLCCSQWCEFCQNCSSSVSMKVHFHILLVLLQPHDTPRYNTVIFIILQYTDNRHPIARLFIGELWGDYCKFKTVTSKSKSCHCRDIGAWYRVILGCIITRPHFFYQTRCVRESLTGHVVPTIIAAYMEMRLLPFRCTLFLCDVSRNNSIEHTLDISRQLSSKELMKDAP